MSQENDHGYITIAITVQVITHLPNHAAVVCPKTRLDCVHHLNWKHITNVMHPESTKLIITASKTCFNVHWAPDTGQTVTLSFHYKCLFW